MASTQTVTFQAKGINFTPKGAEKVAEFLATQGEAAAAAALRVGVRGGGCSGFQYQLAFDEQRESDIVFEDHGLKILVDPQSLAYVDGSQIDYVDSLQGAGFQVNNPNVTAACGCGSPFRVRDGEGVPALCRAGRGRPRPGAAPRCWARAPAPCSPRPAALRRGRRWSRRPPRPGRTRPSG